MREVQDKADKEAQPFAKELEDKLRDALGMTRLRTIEMALNIAFLCGNQYTKADPTGVFDVPNETWEDRKTENMMIRAYRWWMAMLLKTRPTMTAFAGGDELVDSGKAMVAERLGDYWNDNNGWKQAEEEALRWLFVGGRAFIAPVWRKNTIKPTKTHRLEYTDKPEKTDTGKISYLREVPVDSFESDIAFECYPPHRVFTFPLGEHDWRRVTAVMVADIVSREYLEAWYGDACDWGKMKPLAENAIDDDLKANLAEQGSGEFGILRMPEKDREQFLKIDWRERPSLSRPEGRWVTAVGGFIPKDWDRELPYIAEAREADPMDVHNITMGLVPWDILKIPNAEPVPLASELRPIQVAFNDLLTDQAQNRKHGIQNKLVVEQDSLVTKPTNAHGQILEVKPGTSLAPSVLNATPLMGLNDELAQRKMAFQEATGQTESLLGQHAPQVRSGFHFQIMYEASLSNIAEYIRNREQCRELVGRFCLAMARNRYTLDRVVTIYGRERLQHALAFMDAQLHVDIRVVEGSGLPKNHAALQMMAVDLWRYQAYMDPETGKPDVDAFWSQLEYSQLNRNVNARQKMRTKIERDVAKMLYLRLPVLPTEYDDHWLCVKIAREKMNDPEYETAEPEVQALIRTYIKSHAMMLAQQQTQGMMERNQLLPRGTMEQAMRTGRAVAKTGRGKGRIPMMAPQAPGGRSPMPPMQMGAMRPMPSGSGGNMQQMQIPAMGGGGSAG